MVDQVIRTVVIPLWVAATIVVGFGVWAEDDHVIEPAEAVSPQSEQQPAIDLGANFDANLFEQQGNGWVLRNQVNVRLQRQVFLGNGRMIIQGGIAGAAPALAEQPPESQSAARARSIAEKRMARVAESCDIDDRQRRVLEFAIESDIRRFVADIEAVRATYVGVTVNLNDPEGQKRWHQFQQDVQRCRQALRGLFASGSLFAAVLPTTLDPAQIASMEAETRSRRSFRWRAMVVSTLAKMDDMLGLSQDQHDVIERALIDHEPALRLDELAPEQNNAHLQTNLIYMVLSGCDQARFKEVVSDRQWRTLAVLMNQGKSMRSWIEQQGILETP